jgi:hypothetical protein
VEPNKLKTEFLRYEFKYLLPEKLRNAVEAELGHFVEFDPFVANQPNQKYFVRSLYFDDERHSAFYEKTDGMLSRRKFRLRTYSNTPDSKVPIFLEEKGRHNNLVIKNRTRLSESAFSSIADLKRPIASTIMDHTDKGMVAEKFRFSYYKKDLRPVALIDYSRRPYVSRLDTEFRLTFDDNLYATPTNGLWPTDTFGRRNCVPGHTIMEVKFRYHMPAWFHAVVQSYNLRRISISKIVCGMKTLGIAQDLS